MTITFLFSICSSSRFAASGYTAAEMPPSKLMAVPVM